MQLADGTTASTGDVIITRVNDRRLRTSATDWVKNGDRWTIRRIGDDDCLTVAHARTGRIVHLPAGYVAAATDLGYATTIHTTQGVTADTLHGLSTGTQTRQQLYTMLTRGARANHLYLQVVGDGDPHTLIRPETVHPATATDLLEAMLARDDSPRSATTLQRDAHDPAVRLGHATARYVDSLYAAADAHLGPHLTGRLERDAEDAVPGITHADAWPALRAHLLLLAAAGTDPATALRQAAATHTLADADDVAAVLDWRLDDTGHRGTHPGPLPWLPGIPDSLRADPHWGTYLTGRAQLVRELAHTVHDQAISDATHLLPGWARHTGRHPDPDTLAAVALWRAATGTPDIDLRPHHVP